MERATSRKPNAGEQSRKLLKSRKNFSNMKAKCPRKQKGDYFTRNPEESDKNASKPLRAAGVKTWVEERSHLMKTQRARPH